jgi:uncharacterized protein
MELDLGRVEDRLTFSFERKFDLPTPDGGNATCQATVVANVARFENRYDIDVKILGEVYGECNRCLENFAMPVEAGFDLVLHRGDRVQPPSPEEEDDFVTIPAIGECRFDIFPRVREELILALPIKLLCREDCRGVCVKCGADLNKGPCRCEGGTGDPRWGTLKKFLNGENKT